MGSFFSALGKFLDALVNDVTKLFGAIVGIITSSANILKDLDKLLDVFIGFLKSITGQLEKTINTINKELPYFLPAGFALLIYYTVASTTPTRPLLTTSTVSTRRDGG
jgi:hypothetical protein